MPRGQHPSSRKNLKSFKKGETGNPTGINRKRPYTDRLFQRGEEFLSDSPEGEAIRKKLKLGAGTTWADAAAFKVFFEALTGNISAWKEIADRIEGKSPERLEISGPERKEITIRVLHDKESRPKD